MDAYVEGEEEGLTVQGRMCDLREVLEQVLLWWSGVVIP